MTNEKEAPEWYEESPFREVDDWGGDDWNVEKIVAEATRKGEVKAWEEARELAKHKIGLVYRNGAADVDDKLWDSAVDAKLTSLKTT